MVACNSVPLTNVVVSGAPFHVIVEVLTKPPPFTSTLVAPAPAVTVAGLTEAITGAGLFTENCVAADAPPPGEGLTTVTLATEPSARLLAGTVALTLLADVYVVASATPFHCATELEMKPVPEMARTVSFAPAVNEPGDIEEIAGTGFDVGDGVGDGEDPDPPPQPVKMPRLQTTNATLAKLVRRIVTSQLSHLSGNPCLAGKVRAFQ